MSGPTKSRSRPERRKKQRTALSRGVLARYGTLDVIMIDISDAGARIEHFTQLNVGRKARFRYEWQDETIETEAAVMSCKVHRFANEEDGTTVFQSGLFFTNYIGDAASRIHEMIAMLVSRSLAEQVANARGIGPIRHRSRLRSLHADAPELEQEVEPQSGSAGGRFHGSGNRAGRPRRAVMRDVRESRRGGPQTHPTPGAPQR